MDVNAFHTATIDVVNVLHPITKNVSIALQASPEYPWNVPIYGSVMEKPDLLMLIETTCFLAAIWYTRFFPSFHSLPMGDILAIATGMLNTTQAAIVAGMTGQNYTWFQFVQGVNPYNPYLPQPDRSAFWDVYENSTRGANGTIGVLPPWNSPYTGSGYFGFSGANSAPNGILDRKEFYMNASYGDKMGNFKTTNRTRYKSPTNPISRAFVYDEPGQGLRTNSIGMRSSAYAFFMPYLPRGTKPSALVPVFVAFTALTTLVLAVRIWGRWAFLGGLRSFDYAIILGWVLTVSWGVTAIIQNTFIGRYNWDLSMTDLFSKPWLYIAVGVLYPIALLTVKTSLLLFYRTLTELRAYRICIIAVFVLCVFNAILSVYTAVMTYNIQQFWAIVDNPATQFGFLGSPGKRLPSEIPAATVAAAGLNLAMDIVILALPLPLLGMLHKLSVKDTLLAAVTFMAGSLAIVAGALRMKAVKEYLYTHTSGQYSKIVTMNIWILVEMNLAIICASVPALRAIAMKGWPKFLALPFMKSLRFKLFGADQSQRKTKPSANNGGSFGNTLSWDLGTVGGSQASETEQSSFAQAHTPGALEKTKEDDDKVEMFDLEMGILEHAQVVDTHGGGAINPNNSARLGDADFGVGDMEDMNLRGGEAGAREKFLILKSSALNSNYLKLNQSMLEV